MKYVRTLVALPVLACGTTVAATSLASAHEIYPEDGYLQATVVVHDDGPVIAVDDAVAERLQAGASAIGGAGLALTLLWAYRRRHPIRVQ